jgi:hypothetical protein
MSRSSRFLRENSRTFLPDLSQSPGSREYGMDIVEERKQCRRRIYRGTLSTGTTSCCVKTHCESGNVHVVDNGVEFAFVGHMANKRLRQSTKAVLQTLVRGVEDVRDGLFGGAATP